MIEMITKPLRDNSAKASLYSKCGRIFSNEEINLIIDIVKRMYNTGRCSISRTICKELNWIGENGKYKEWVCREFLIQLEKDGILILPPPVPKSFNRFKKKNFELFQFKEPEKLFDGSLSDFNKPIFNKVTNSDEHTFWEYLVAKYHYLSYKSTIGRFLKYIIYIDTTPVACIGYTGAALKVANRDKFICWDDTTRRKNIKYIANNFRFVIFPWVKIKYLASHILSKSVSLVVADWKSKYNVDILALETFVEKNRFAGTIYKAANWKYVGETKGYAKTKTAYSKHGVIKDVYVYPVYPDSLSLLRDNSDKSSLELLRCR